MPDVPRAGPGSLAPMLDPGDVPAIVAALGKLDNLKGSTERHARHCQIRRANRTRF
jgi:hypothetical protein